MGLDAVATAERPPADLLPGPILICVRGEEAGDRLAGLWITLAVVQAQKSTERGRNLGLINRLAPGPFASQLALGTHEGHPDIAGLRHFFAVIRPIRRRV